MIRHLQLYTRPGCHLCEEMEQLLEELGPGLGIEVEQRRVDDDPSLAARWGDEVPVLTLDGREICRYWLDLAALKEALVEAGEP